MARPGALLGQAGVPLLLAVTRLGQGSNLQTVTSA
jgi:hypothetical protein